MRDAKEHLERLDLLEAPDVWPDVWRDAHARGVAPRPEIVETGGRAGQRLVAGVVALVVFGGAVLLGVRVLDTPTDRTATSPPISPPREPAGVWRQLPPPPIAFRYGAAGFWVDGRVVIVGGSEAAPDCPRDAFCSEGRTVPLDGAAFDPSSGTWTTISEAPAPVMPYSGAVVGDTLYVWGSEDEVTETLLAYHVADDRWEELEVPPSVTSSLGFLRLAAAGDAVLAYLDSQEHGVSPDFLFHPSTGRWEELPPDPLIPSFDRSMVWTGTEVVLIATKAQPPQLATYEDRVAILDVANAVWRRLPNSGTEGNPTWFWSAGRVVNPEIGHVGDNGSVEGTGPPYGGIFDPSTGEWSELPSAPERLTSYGGPSVGGSRFVVSDEGAILDVDTGSWEPLPAPPIAADEGAVAVWAGDRLVVWGGIRWKSSERGPSVVIDGDPLVSDQAEIVEAGWSWIPTSQ